MKAGTTARRDNHAELESRIEGKRCVVCDGVPQIANNRGGPEAYRLRCNCTTDTDNPVEPTLGPEIGRLRRRYAKMVMEKTKQGPGFGIAEIKAILAPDATDAQAELLLRFCEGHDLDPFMQEAYLIIRGGRPTIQIGVAALIKKADRHPQYDGYRSGVILENATGDYEEREGTFFAEGETLLGGWAIVYRKDRTHPRISKLRIEERMQKKDGRPAGTWASMPGGQIEKCAVGQAHKRAFPDVLGPLFDNPEARVEIVDEMEMLEASAAQALDAPTETPQQATLTPSEVETPQEDPDGLKDLFPAREDNGHAASAPEGSKRTFANIGEFLTAVREKWGNKYGDDVCAALGVKQPVEITDFTKAWAELEKLWK